MSPHREYAYIKRKQRTDSGPIPWQSVSWRYPWQFVSRCNLCLGVSGDIYIYIYIYICHIYIYIYISP